MCVFCGRGFSVTQKELNRIIRLRSEIKTQAIIMKNSCATVGDYGLDHSTGKKRAFTIQGKHAPAYYEAAKKHSADSNELEALVATAKKFIAEIPDSQIRLILSMRYIEGKQWSEVAHVLYNNSGESSARMAATRWLKKNHHK
jgi:hypothetical protein